MEGFKITINGKQVCTTGLQEEGILSLDVLLRKLPNNDGDVIPEIEITVHGLLDVPQDSSEDFDASDSVVWLRRSLTIGDEIRINIVETQHSDPPEQKRRHHRYEGCSFCGKKRAELSNSEIIAGAEANICKMCAESYLLQLSDEAQETAYDGKGEQETITCAFCGKRFSHVSRMFLGKVSKSGICAACVMICGEVLEEQKAKRKKSLHETTEDE